MEVLKILRSKKWLVDSDKKTIVEKIMMLKVCKLDYKLNYEFLEH